MFFFCLARVLLQVEAFTDLSLLLDIMSVCVSSPEKTVLLGSGKQISVYHISVDLINVQGPGS